MFYFRFVGKSKLSCDYSESRMRLESALGTARVYVNSADECHGSQTRIYNLFAHGRKKCATHVPCYVFFVGHCCVKQITFRFEKAASRQRKIYIMKKAIMLDTHLSLRFANLSNNE